MCEGQTVSTHAPARGATDYPPRKDFYGKFQPTRPRGARPATASGPRGDPRGFNPRARAGRDGAGDTHNPVWRVSTHAPARGATSTSDHMARVAEFQPTRPRGARRCRGFAIPASPVVSTHAPARGATTTCAHGPPRARFQPTRPRGARQKHHGYLGSYQGFNPRARAGRDIPLTVRLNPRRTFQPTRPRGARHRVQRQLLRDAVVSTHAPARGATPGTGGPHQEGATPVRSANLPTFRPLT